MRKTPYTDWLDRSQQYYGEDWWTTPCPPCEHVVAPQNRASILPSDAKERKTYPVATGVLDYFPDAIVALAHLSWIGNEQHNPGEPLHWAREKSTDQDDTLIRHFMERGKIDKDGISHTAKMAWRALALLQLEIESQTQGRSITDNPERAKNEPGCGQHGPHWRCERVKGHSGKHMAWDVFYGPGDPRNELYEHGEWQ